MADPQKNSSTNPSGWLRYTSLGFQMMATIGLAVWLGRFLDAKTGMEQIPAFTIGLLLLAVVGSLIGLIRGFTKNQ
ncbi:MAG: AtpZ/AtpI family protein [Verrucomicrobia bacterium]|nr:AtpZ/AtpI family protein [Cytophagales bacterium]